MGLFRRWLGVVAPAEESPTVARMPSTFADALASAGDADPRVRAAAGVILASTPELEPVTDVLMRLLLDHEDTFVTSETAGALIGRRDVSGMRLVVLALSRAAAGESTADWIWDAILYYAETPEDDTARIVTLEALRSESEITATVEEVLEGLKG